MDIAVFEDLLETTKTQTRKQRKQSRRQKRESKNTFAIAQQPLQLENIKPLTENQKKVFKEFTSGKHMLLHGCPGSGKSFLALYLGLREILTNPNTTYKKIILIRSAQSGKDMGFLPGSAKQKMAVYEEPYIGICAKLFGRQDAYHVLKGKGIIQFESTSFLRGVTFEDAIVIFDEFQNSPIQGATTVLSRVDDNCRVIVCGDSKQDDLTSERYKEESCAKTLIKIFSNMSGCSIVQFSVDDIVRSGFVKQLLMAMIKLGLA
jgi:phosphate starvation-inducible protein PhoH